MAIPVISDIFDLLERDSDFLDIQNVTIPPPQEGRILVISVLSVSSNNPGAIVDDITIQGSFLGNGIIQIGTDQIARSESGSQRYAMSGLYFVRNADMGSVPLRVQIFTQVQVRELYACVYSVTGVAAETRDALRGQSSPIEIPADNTFGSNLTTTVANCLVVDHWALNTGSQPNSTVFQTPVIRRHYGRGAGIVTSRVQANVGVASFTQQIDQDNLAQAWHIVAWPGLASPPTDVNAGGPYSGEINTAIAILGTHTDGDITPVTVLWEIVSGGSGVFGNDSIASTTFSPLNTGAYTLRYTVSDGTNPPVSATTTLNSLAVPPSNVDAGGPYSEEWTLAGAIAGSFTAGTDPAPSVKWTIFSGGTGTFANDTALITTFKPNSINSYVLRMTITPAEGPAVEDFATYEAFAVPPVNVDAGGPYSGAVTTPIQLTGSVDLGTDTNPAYAWTIVSGGAGSFDNFTNQNAVFTPGQVGPYVLQFSVDPNTGPAITDNANLDSVAFPPTAVNTGAPYDGIQTLPTQLNGSFSLGTVPDPTLLWTVPVTDPPGRSAVFSDDTLLNPLFTPLDVGIYTLRLTVDDGINPPVVAEGLFTSNAPLPPTNVDAGGPHRSPPDVPHDLNGSFTPGSLPTQVLWTQESGAFTGVFDDDTALDTQFTYPELETVTLRLTITPSDGPAIFDETTFSAEQCRTPQISPNSVTHLTTGVYYEYDNVFAPGFVSGDLSINRLRLSIDSSAPASELTVVQQIGSNLRLFFSADLSTYHISDSSGNSAASFVLAEPLPMDILFLLGIRMTWIDVASQSATHEIFVNNISQGIIQVSNLATNDMGRMFTGRIGVTYLSIQHEFKLAGNDSIYITSPVGEGAGTSIKASGTNCIDYFATIGGLINPHTDEFIWNIDSQHLNDAMLRALASAVGATTVNDGLLKYYQLHDATSNISRDAEREFLIARGVPPGQIHDMWTEFLLDIPSLQLQGSLMDMKLQWWLLGAPIR